MCYEDIDCIAPTSQPSSFPSAFPTGSSRPTMTSSTVPSSVPSKSGIPTPFGQTKEPTLEPTSSHVPTDQFPTYYPTRGETIPPVNIQNTITTRGSYCGTSWQNAVNDCSPNVSCNTNDDCTNENETCYDNISCTYHATEDTENYLGSSGSNNKDATGDDLYGTELDGDDDDDFVPVWETSSSSTASFEIVSLKYYLGWCVCMFAFCFIG